MNSRRLIRLPQTEDAKLPHQQRAVLCVTANSGGRWQRWVTNDRSASVAQPYPGATAGGGNSQNISFNGIMIGTTAFFNQFAAQIARTQQQYAQLNPSLA